MVTFEALLAEFELEFERDPTTLRCYAVPGRAVVEECGRHPTHQLGHISKTRVA